MFNGAIAMARIDGLVALVQGERLTPRLPPLFPALTHVPVVQTSSQHIEVIRYTYFEDHTFLANFTSSPPQRISRDSVLQFLPSTVTTTGDTLTLPHDLFKQFIERSTENQTQLEAKWQRAMAAGGITLPHAALVSGR